MFKHINDLLALLVLVVIFPALWILDARGVIILPGQIQGAMIAAFTMIIQYYFRKKPDETK